MNMHIATTVLLALLVGTKVTAAGNAKTEETWLDNKTPATAIELDGRTLYRADRTDDSVPELTCYTGDGIDYRGRLSNTINGRTCQSWSDQTPHTHTHTKEKYQYGGLEENYCRNPDGKLKPWCYTTDKWKRWEYCHVPQCPGVPLSIAGKIVKRHNRLRRDVQPTASNMLKMSWNQDAATTAQRWANKCDMTHSPVEERTIGPVHCGENVFISDGNTPWDAIIHSWYSEIKIWKYGMPGMGSIDGNVVEWYRSNQIGCGMAFCKATYQFYVCHYCLAGNVGGGATPYQVRPACGGCPNKCDAKPCTNSCPYNNKYDDCPLLSYWRGCDNPTIAGWCPASCKCAQPNMKF